VPSTQPNPDQVAAIGAGGTVFVSAGAGTGKTTVIVERFLRALDDGLDVDSILVITFTDRAAGELRSRIRARLVESGRVEAARELDGAWISTIHGFCHRLLRLYATEAGLDPRFRVLDESQATVLRAESFTAALAEFCADGSPDRIRLLATYRADGLRRMLGGVADTLRSAGRGLSLELGVAPDLEARKEELRLAAAAVLADTEGDVAAENGRAQVRHGLALIDSSPPLDLLLDLSAVAVRGRGKDRFAAYEDARQALEQTALNVAAVRDRELLEDLLGRFDRAYQQAKDRESGLDFEDLQIRARDLLRDHDEVRAGLRFRSVMVDEFQDQTGSSVS
jgi:ATP-dependent exoDNAse (exonuclease V) beta subunit